MNPHLYLRLTAWPKALVVGLGLAAVAALGVVDYFTGTELSFSLFYLLPICFVGWFAGRTAGVVTAIASAAAWLTAERLWDVLYASPIIPYWNALVRLGFFLIVNHLLVVVRELRRPLERAAQEALTALRFSEEKLRRLLEAAPDAIVVSDRQGRILLVNGQTEKFFGYARAELIGQPVERLVPERFWDKHVAQRAQYYDRPEPRTVRAGVELFGRRKDGSEFPAEITLGPVELEGELVVFSIVRDVSERKRAEAELREQRDELAARARVVSAILTTRDLDRRLKIILEETMGLLRAEMGGIWLVEGPKVQLRAWRGFSDDFRAETMGFPRPSAPPWLTDSLVIHQRLSEQDHMPEVARREGIQAWVSLPLALPRSPADAAGAPPEWLGTLVVASRRYDTFNPRDVEVVQAMGAQLALAIDHVRHYRDADQRARRLAALHDIDLAIISERSIRDILNVVLERVPRELGADAVAFSLLEADPLRTQLFVMRLPNGTILGEEAFHLSDGLLHAFAERQEPVIIYDLLQDPRVQMHREHIRNNRLVSYLGVPLVAQGRTIGILHLLTTQPRVFAEEDVSFFRTLAGQAAIALRNAQSLVEVRESERKYRSIVEDAVEGICQCTPEGRFLSANPAMAQMLGYDSPEQLIASVSDIGAQLFAQPGRAADFNRSLEQHGAVHGFEAELCRQDGQAIWVAINARTVRDGTGKLCHHDSIVLDITEWKCAQQALWESERKHRLVLDNIDEIVYSVRVKSGNMYVGTVEFVSAQVENLTGHRPADFMTKGDLWFTLIHPDDVAAVIRLTEEISVRGTGGTRVYRMRRKAGDYIWIEDHVVPQMNESGRLTRLFGVARDITERKRAEEQLRQYSDQLRALAARLEEVREEERTRIAREIHDELGQALTRLKLDLAGLGSAVAHPGTAGSSAFAERIQAMTTQVDATVQAVRKISSALRPGVLDDLGLPAAIEWQAQDFQRWAGIRCQCQVPAEPPAMEPARATALFRTLQEALTNVARHARASRVDVALTVQEGQAVLTIKDNGRGIREAEVANPRSLGLLGMRERAALLGGAVSIKGAPDQGTAVQITIPVGLAPGAASGPEG